MYLISNVLSFGSCNIDHGHFSICVVSIIHCKSTRHHVPQDPFPLDMLDDYRHVQAWKMVIAQRWGHLIVL